MSTPLPRVLVAEPSAPLGNAYRKFLEGWAEVQVVTYVDEALQLVRARPPDVLLASVTATFDGEVLVPQVRKHAPEVAIVLAYPVSEAEKAPERARAAGVEGFVVLPPKKHHVLALVQAVARLNGLALQLKRLRAAFEQLKAQVKVAPPPPPRPAAAPLNAPDEAFFKKYMLLEVKRSRRYKYPVALMLVAFDDLQAHLGDTAPEFQRAAIRTEALEVLTSLLRDIDVALPFGDDKYILFLPFTPLEGARVVATRVQEHLSRLESLHGGTASVGVASFDPATLPKEKAKAADDDEKAIVSFGGLVRTAAEALKRAQDAGGNRVDAPAPPEPVKKGKKKKSRISLG